MTMQWKNATFPLWLKIAATCYLALFIPVYWQTRGPSNFLWFCDIALFLAVFTLWRRHPLPASMMGVGVLLFELCWILDFIIRLLWGTHLFGLGPTRYVFSDELPLVIRIFSTTLHLLLPTLLIYLIAKMGYDQRAWLAQSLLAWLVLPVSYAVSDPINNINWVYGVGTAQSLMPPLLYLVLQMLALPLLVYYPSHLLLKRCFKPNPHP